MRDFRNWTDKDGTLRVTEISQTASSQPDPPQPAPAQWPDRHTQPDRPNFGPTWLVEWTDDADAEWFSPIEDNDLDRDWASAERNDQAAREDWLADRRRELE